MTSTEANGERCPIRPMWHRCRPQGRHGPGPGGSIATLPALHSHLDDIETEDAGRLSTDGQQFYYLNNIHYAETHSTLAPIYMGILHPPPCWASSSADCSWKRPTESISTHTSRHSGGKTKTGEPYRHGVRRPVRPQGAGCKMAECLANRANT